MTAPTRRARGFTLVEIMIVVAIIGILSSVALPTFKTFSLRTRQAERRMVMKTIKESAEDFYVRFGRVEDLAGNPLGFLLGAPNPAGPASATKRPFNPAAAGWGQLGVTERLLEGSLYYTYTWFIIDIVGTKILWQQAEGDLDMDGRLSNRQVTYELRDQVYTITSEWPPTAVGGVNAEDMEWGTGFRTW